MKAHVSEAKKEEVLLLRDLLKKYSVIGVVDITNLPSPQLQKLRSQLKDSLLIRIIKKRLIRLALEQLKQDKDLIGLEKYLEKSMPGLIFTNQDPFKLYKILKKSKSSAPAKAGQIAPRDIIIPAGPTDFPPGPIIGELGQIGIVSSVEDGKVVVKKDSLVARAGEEIKPKVAEVLSKLGIEPMEIGLNVVAIYDNGVIYTKDVLDIDEERYINGLKEVYLGALNLALEIGYITKENVEVAIGKASRGANALAKVCYVEVKEEDVKEKISKVVSDSEKLKTELEKKVPETKEKVEEEKETSKAREKFLKQNIMKAEYSEEEARKAQEIIDAMKDKDIELKEKKKKKYGG